MIYDKNVRISDAALMKLSPSQLTRYQQEWENDVYLRKHQEVIDWLADELNMRLSVFNGQDFTSTLGELIEQQAKNIHEQVIAEWKTKFRFDFPILVKPEYRTTLTFTHNPNKGSVMSIAGSRELIAFAKGIPRVPIFTADSPQARRDQLLRAR